MNKLTINIPDDRDKLYQIIRYPAGEIQVRLTEDAVRAVKAAVEYTIVANPIPDIIELAQLKSAIDGVKKFFWTRLDIPYLPYARADRRFVPGDSFGLQVFANLINSLHFHSVHAFDVHSDVAEKEILNLINLSPIFSYDDIEDTIKNVGRDGLVLIAPDKGAASRYDLKTFLLPVLTAGKVRDAETGKLSGFTIDPTIAEYEKALIVDDICDGGGTFIGLAKEIRRFNPYIKLYLYVSHGIFSQGLPKLYEQFDVVYISDFSFKGDESKGWQKI